MWAIYAFTMAIMIAVAIYYVILDNEENTEDFKKSYKVLVVNLTIQTIVIAALSMLIVIAMYRFSRITSSLNRNVQFATKTHYCFSIFSFLWLVLNLTTSIIDMIKYNDCTVYVNVTTITWSKLVSVIVDVILILILAYMLEKISLSYFNHAKRVEA